MALTTSTTYGDMILPEIIANLVLEAPTPKAVVSKLANFVSIAGQPTGSIAMPRFADLGAAANVAENADVSSTTLSMGTQSTFTPAYYGMMGEVTFKAMREKMPGLTSVYQLFDGTATVDQQLAVFAQEAQRLKNAMDEAIETAACADFASLSDSVGSTTVDLTIANLEEAIFEQAKNEIRNENLAFCLAPAQLFDLRSAITSSTATIFSTDVQSIINVTPDLSLDGLRGSLFGIPVYEMSQSVVATANAGADVVGALIIRGSGEPTSSDYGTLVVCEGCALHYTFDADMSKRAAEIQINYEFDVGLRAADLGVKIVTDA